MSIVRQPVTAVPGVDKGACNVKNLGYGSNRDASQPEDFVFKCPFGDQGMAGLHRQAEWR